MKRRILLPFVLLLIASMALSACYVQRKDGTREQVMTVTCACVEPDQPSGEDVQGTADSVEVSEGTDIGPAFVVFMQPVEGDELVVEYVTEDGQTVAVQITAANGTFTYAIDKLVVSHDRGDDAAEYAVVEFLPEPIESDEDGVALVHLHLKVSKASNVGR